MKRRGESAISTLIALAILGVALYMVFPAWFTWLPIGQSSSTMTMTITYKDGSTRVVEGGLLPQTVTDTSNLEIDGISWTVKVTPVYTGTATSTSVTGNVICMVDGVSKKTTAVSYATKINSGVNTQVNTGSVTASALEGYNTVLGSHIFKVQADLTLTVTVASALTKTASSSGSIGYVVKANEGITSFSIAVAPATFGGV